MHEFYFFRWYLSIPKALKFALFYCLTGRVEKFKLKKKNLGKDPGFTQRDPVLVMMKISYLSTMMSGSGTGSSLNM